MNYISFFTHISEQLLLINTNNQKSYFTIRSVNLDFFLKRQNSFNYLSGNNNNLLVYSNDLNINNFQSPNFQLVIHNNFKKFVTYSVNSLSALTSNLNLNSLISRKSTKKFRAHSSTFFLRILILSKKEKVLRIALKSDTT